MNRISRWLLYGLLMVLSGCMSYTTLDLDVLEPAKVKFPVDIASVVIVDNAPVYRDTALHVVKSGSHVYVMDTLYVDDFGRRLTESLARSLKSQAFFDSVFVAPNLYEASDSTRIFRSLTPFQIDRLGRQYHAQAVIVLDRYDYNTTTNVVDLSDYYYLTLDARSSAYWKVYNAVDNRLMDVHLQQDTIFWDSESSGLTQAFKLLPGLKEAVQAEAENSGAEYASYLAPSWSTVTRSYYIQGHPLFYQATKYVLKNQWEKALSVWYKVYEEGRTKQKARSAFNMALGQEVLGRYQEALAWAYRSSEHYRELGGLAVSDWERKQAELYYIQLSMRVQKKKKLDEQFGFDE